LEWFVDRDPSDRLGAVLGEKHLAKGHDRYFKHIACHSFLTAECPVAMETDGAYAACESSIPRLIVPLFSLMVIHLQQPRRQLNEAHLNHEMTIPKLQSFT
jgi:hypothetical protein